MAHLEVTFSCRETPPTSTGYNDMADPIGITSHRLRLLCHRFGETNKINRQRRLRSAGDRRLFPEEIWQWLLVKLTEHDILNIYRWEIPPIHPVLAIYRIMKFIKNQFQRMADDLRTVQGARAARTAIDGDGVREVADACHNIHGGGIVVNGDRRRLVLLRRVGSVIAILRDTVDTQGWDRIWGSEEFLGRDVG